MVALLWPAHQARQRALVIGYAGEPALHVLKELLAAHEDGSAVWLYTQALVAFRESGGGDELAAALVRDAWSANEHVPAILAGTKPAVNSNEGYITTGGPDEATQYVTECGAAWHRTPAAVAWLTKLAATLAHRDAGAGAVHPINFEQIVR